MKNQARFRVAVPAFALLSALAATSAGAATGRVSGQVLDPTGNAVEGVEVACGAARTATLSDGLYALDGVDGGRVVVGFSKAGYAAAWGAVFVPSGGDGDGDGVPDADDRCPLSDRRPRVTIDGCDTGLGNGWRDGCTAQDVFLDCAARARKRWHLLGCLAEPRFLRRAEGLTWKTLKRSIACVKRATLPLAEASEPPPPPAAAGATLHRTLLPEGGPVTVDPGIGGAIQRSGFKATFAAGAIGGDGFVQAFLAPVDVAGPALGAVPGDFRGVDDRLQPALLETFGALDLRLERAGQPVPLAAPAALEVPLPEGSPFEAGDVVSLWSFDGAAGLWRERIGGSDVLGVVGRSTLLPGRLAAFATVDRPGWWALHRAVETACLCGHVEDEAGAPVEGALVTASGVGYFGAGFATSGSDGDYCVDARRDSAVRLAASVVAGGRRRDTPAAPASTPPGEGSCATGGCGDGPVLAFSDATTCATGRLLDSLGRPTASATVQPFDALTGQPLGPAVFPDGDGWYTVAGLPRGALVDLVTVGPDCAGRVTIDTGLAPAGEETCLPVPELTCGLPGPL
jgi:hypothetical protein